MSNMRISGDRASRRRWLTLVAAATVATALAGCGSAAGSGKASSSSSASGTALTMWLVTTGPSPINTVINQAVSAFEKSHPGRPRSRSTTSRTSRTSRRSSSRWARATRLTIFWTWGGGPLKQFINAGDVASLGKPGWASDFLPSSLGAVTFNGQLYGVPIEGTQPVYFFYNKTIFSKLGLTFPTTWSGLLSTMSTLKSHGTRRSRWPTATSGRA